MPLDYRGINAGRQEFSLANGDGESNTVFPSYQYAADNHNYGNGNFAITDPDTWSAGLDSAGKFIQTATLSGLNGFYNTAAAVGSWAGMETEQRDTAAYISDIDTDLGKYYKENAASVDLAGFIAGSLIPGLAGVKLLNMGQKVLRTAQQSGQIGANLSRATGLLTPAVDTYRSLAAVEIAQSAATFSSISGNTLRAIGAGYGQAALEGAAFEVAVAATSFKSPVLNEADGWDIAKNIALGTVIGGVIGGAINQAVTVGRIKGAVKSFTPAEKQFADTSSLEGLSASQRIIARQDRLATIPVAPSADDIAAGTYEAANKLLVNLSADQKQVAASQLSSRLGKLREETIGSLEAKNAIDFQALTSGNDSAIARQISDMSKGLTPNQSVANMESLVELGRMNTKLKSEQKLGLFNRKQSSSTGITDLLDAAPGAASPPIKIGFVTLNGERAGAFSFDPPKILNLADEAQDEVDVLRKVKSFGFKETKQWDATKAGHQEAEARYIWADTAKLDAGAKIGEFDIPLLERAVALKLPQIEVVSANGNYVIQSADDIAKHVQVSKQEAALALVQGKTAGTGVTTEEIAKITNVRQSFLEGEISTNQAADLYARQGYKAAYVKDLEQKGIWTQAKEDGYFLQPSTAKAAYDTSIMQAVDANQIQGMAYIKAQQKLYQQGIDTAFAQHVPEELAGRFWHPGDDMMLKTNRFGAGPGLVSFANGGYHTPESWAEAIGSATAALQKDFKAKTTEALTSPLYKIATKQEVAIEFESINKTLQSTSELYGINPEGTAIEALKMLDYKAAIKAGETGIVPPVLQEGAPSIIPIKSPDVLEAWNIRAQLNGDRTQAFQEIRNAQGLTDIKDSRALRPIRHDPKDYPYYAVVSDPSVTGVGHKSMIHAASPAELEKMISKVPSNYKVYKGDQLKQFFKSEGEFDWEMTLHENYINSDLKRSGVNNPFFVRTDPELIAKSFLNDHLRSDDIFTRELVNAKYEKEFSFLRQQGEQYTNTATSKYTGSYRDIENTVKNPYTNYMKTALNVSQIAEYPLWQGLNTKLDSAVSKIAGTIADLGRAAKTPADLDGINAQLREFGIKSAYYDAAVDALANHSAPRGALTSFVGKANAMISTLVTRLDPFNAINNAVGATVLYGSELKSFIGAMGRSDTELAGKLSGMLKTPMASEGLLNPATAGAVPQVTTQGKVMQQAIANWFNKDATTVSGQNLREYYKANGWSTRLMDQHTAMMDELTLVGTEDAGILASKTAKAFAAFKQLADKGEKITGNKYVEEMNRFLAADSMRQLTDIGVAAGKITEKEALGYINTFVNRTQGNILASQRPLMFQGAIGQAVGLFQSYQFNMMQQLFRHVGEGTGKDAAMLLGLQGTMYGMNGLPAFNYLNTHIVGTMSGNPKHTDAYSAVYGIAGKSVGDLLLYGLPSNLFRANLYSRGDINPRQVTVIPVNPVDIPFVSATMKLYDTVANSVSKSQNGATLWQSLLSGIEHNGLSRPLSGVAQVAQAISHEGTVFSTTKKSSISASNDLYSWATAVRLAGAKPMDEAIANDATFRLNVYKMADREKLLKLSGAVRSSSYAGDSADPDQIAKFAEKYAAAGGKQQNFNKFMINEIKNANVSNANKIMENLKSPYAQKMQQIMGGNIMADGRVVQSYGADSLGDEAAPE